VTDPLYVAARGVLLDALEGLGEQRDALILAGAQAIYVHTGAADLAIAEFTTDGDLVVVPDQLKGQPRLSEAMERAQFRPGVQPGSWPVRPNCVGHSDHDSRRLARAGGRSGRRAASRASW